MRNILIWVHVCSCSLMLKVLCYFLSHCGCWLHSKALYPTLEGECTAKLEGLLCPTNKQRKKKIACFPIWNSWVWSWRKKAPALVACEMKMDFKGPCSCCCSQHWAFTVSSSVLLLLASGLVSLSSHCLYQNLHWDIHSCVCTTHSQGEIISKGQSVCTLRFLE